MGTTCTVGTPDLFVHPKWAGASNIWLGIEIKRPKGFGSLSAAQKVLVDAGVSQVATSVEDALAILDCWRKRLLVTQAIEAKP